MNLYNYFSKIPYICIGRWLVSSIVGSALELGPVLQRAGESGDEEKVQHKQRNSGGEKRPVQRESVLCFWPELPLPTVAKRVGLCYIMFGNGFPFSACRNKLLVAKPSPWPATSPILTQAQIKHCLKILPRTLSFLIPWGTLMEQCTSSARRVWLFPGSLTSFQCKSSKGYLLCSQQEKDISEPGEADLRMYLNLSCSPFLCPVPPVPSLPRYSIKAPTTLSTGPSTLESQTSCRIIVLLVFSSKIKEDAGREQCFTRNKLQI